MRPDGVFDPVDWGALEVAAPFVTFEQRLNVYVDDLLVELHHFGTAAHSTNDVVAWIPERRVLFTGDLVFNGGTPFVLMGSVAGALMVLDRLMEYDAEVLVPGHGPPCHPQVVDTVGEYLRFVQDTAAQASAAGLSPLDAARQTDLGPYRSLTDPERIVGNLHRAYAECAGARPGDPIDVSDAFVDMVAYNGGRAVALHGLTVDQPRSAAAPPPRPGRRSGPAPGRGLIPGAWTRRLQASVPARVMTSTRASATAGASVPATNSSAFQWAWAPASA